ncbi:MAG TPA: hypothetical protein VJH03_01350 [Blastocatellia bacterium]|nr:hypothetical protein [Blastocatellia bacterium]
MKRTLITIAALVVTAITQVNTAGQSTSDRPDSSRPSSATTTRDDSQPTGSELDRLKQRIDELERQNRAMMQLLEELKHRLDVPRAPANASTAQPAAAEVPRRPTNVLPRIRVATAPKPRAAERSTPAPAADSATATESAAQQSAKPTQPASSEPVRWSEIVGEGNRFKFYGLLRLDLDIDSQRPNNAQVPFFITSEDPRIGKPNAGSFSMHPRLTRFGVDYTGPRVSTLGDGRLTGKLELDFENGGSESRQIIRIRHAYLKMNWKDFSILGGQTWDIFSPLFPTVNGDTLMWTAGNIGDRRPQFRFAYEPKAGHGQWSLTGGVGLTGAIDLLDLDGNGFRDGEESGQPDVQARIAYSRSLWVKDQAASIGASGFYGWLNTSRPVTGANRTSFRSQVINLDYTLPLASRVSLRGEGWWGRNMSDLRGGAGQGVNLATGRDIRGRGGWSEMSVKVSRYYSFHPGFTVDDPVDFDLGAGGRIRNRAFYIGNRITPGGNFLIGFDYLRWRTDFKAFLPGIDNRVNIFIQYGY